MTKSRLSVTPSVGGLATALRSYFELASHGEFDSLHWVGISDISRTVFERASTLHLVEKDNVVMHPVFLPTQAKERFYDGFCNSIIWPLFQYFPSFVIYKQEFFDEYVRANELLAAQIQEIFEPGDTVWVHDYHWMLLPELVRGRIESAKIGFFLHIPFPSFELFRMLPKAWGERIARGLAGADVIGFQTADFASYYVDSLRRILPGITFQDDVLTVNGRSSVVKEFPISIDFEKYHAIAASRQIRSAVTKIRHRLTAHKLILSVDRLDYTKAIFSRLESFELFLEKNPDMREKVSYLLLLVPSRETILKYKENKQNVDALISRINGLYGTIGWTPIVYMYKSVDQKRLVSLYAAADIALVVPARDGMNLVAKEYVASRPDGDGVLILSDTAGAAEELREAVLVNSNDRQEIADSIREGLKMPKAEQRRRMARMQEHVREHGVLAWATEFLESVDQMSGLIKTTT